MNLFPRRKASEPIDQATLHPLMQAHYDPDLPYWVASDHAVWGTFDDLTPAIRLAEQVAVNEPVGERVVVTLLGVGVHTAPGRSQRKRSAASR